MASSGEWHAITFGVPHREAGLRTSVAPLKIIVSRLVTFHSKEGSNFCSRRLVSIVLNSGGGGSKFEIEMGSKKMAYRKNSRVWRHESCPGWIISRIVTRFGPYFSTHFAILLGWVVDIKNEIECPR